MINGMPVETNSFQLLLILSNTIVASFNSASNILASFILVHPRKARMAFINNLEEELKILNALDTHISDNELKVSLEAYSKSLHSLHDIGKEIYLSRFNEDYPNNQLSTKQTKHPLPDWYNSAKYQNLLKRIFSIMEIVLQSTEKNIHIMRSLRTQEGTSIPSESEETVLKKIPEIREMMRNGIVLSIEDEAYDQ